MTLYTPPIGVNQFPAKCRNCGVWLEKGAGVLMRKHRSLMAFCASHPFLPSEQADFERDRLHQTQGSSP